MNLDRQVTNAIQLDSVAQLVADPAPFSYTSDTNTHPTVARPTTNSVVLIFWQDQESFYLALTMVITKPVMLHDIFLRPPVVDVWYNSH